MFKAKRFFLLFLLFLAVSGLWFVWFGWDLVYKPGVFFSETGPAFIENYGVDTNITYEVVATNKLGSLPGEDTPLTPWHRRYVPGDVVDLSLDVDKDYDQRVVKLDYYEKSYADLCGATKKWHIPLPQKLTVRVWYAEGLPYKRVPRVFPCTMDEFKGSLCRRWIAVKCLTTFSGCYSMNIFEISDADPNFENLMPGSDEFVAMCWRYSNSVDKNVRLDIARRYKHIDRDRDFYFHMYKIDSEGLWKTTGAYKFDGVKDKSSWRWTQTWFELWRLKESEDM